MIDCASGIGAETEAVCELFAPTHGPVYEYLRFNAETPLQVPFYYLKLVREGKTERRGGRSPAINADAVEIASRAILQRAPDSELAAKLQESCLDRRQLVHELLTSAEFVARMPQLFARSFPQVRRLWHVHVPKTAGTSFSAAANASGWGFINTNRLAGAVGNLAEVANALRLGPETRGRVIITGHWHLWRFMDAIEPFDRVVAFVRDPVESMISEFNFAVDVVRRSEKVHTAEPSVMLDRGLDPDSLLNSYRQGFFVANVQCSYLAQDFTCATALANLARFQSELLPSAAVDYATKKYFARVADQRVNVSHKHTTSSELGGALREEFMIRSSQDLLLSEIANRRFADLN